MVVTIYSLVKEKNIDVVFTAKGHARLSKFVSERASDGKWFTPRDIDMLMPSQHQGDDLFDTSAIVQAFLPSGFGVEMHGWEDFCIVPDELV